MATVLFVEDQEITALNTKEFLTKEGHTVHLASNGLEGLAVLDNNKDIEIIFTDFKMPQVNGSEFVNTIKTNPKYTRYIIVPIVGVGSFPKDKQDQLSECLNKPYSLNELTRCIVQYCKK